MFSLLICLSAGMKPIITSSSDEKLRDIAALGPEGAIKVINYRTNPAWKKKALRLTGGMGDDIVIETVGGTSIKQSIESLATRGVVAWVAFLGGLELDGFAEALGQLYLKVGTLRSIQVGSKVDQSNLYRFFETTKTSLKPIIGKTFPFAESPAAFDCLMSENGTWQGFESKAPTIMSYMAFLSVA
ncbi:hypothetical protein PENANT_c042G01528 [Penicillium antarcticum]|uniref:Alcohol dehydrogenase-like C-terminal domain-containing protein n=1 Tax=Penicillium antarcticum TaxID=416450 RepID=A0A1V6PT58_9EURO|nr:hypothetical protein PENANT_c042G01528 [Penicillium antarcticum]